MTLGQPVGRGFIGTAIEMEGSRVGGGRGGEGVHWDSHRDGGVQSGGRRGFIGTAGRGGGSLGQP